MIRAIEDVVNLFDEPKDKLSCPVRYALVKLQILKKLYKIEKPPASASGFSKKWIMGWFSWILGPFLRHS